jgi:hypothetical protein
MMFRHGQEWLKFVSQLKVIDARNNEATIELLAYSWLVFQRQWTLRNWDVPIGVLNDTNSKARKPTTKEWKAALKPLSDRIVPKGIELHETRVTAPERKAPNTIDELRWKKETIPLLARPEIGLPPHVQMIILKSAKLDDTDCRALHLQRRRLLTDAMHAGMMQQGAGDFGVTKDADIESLIQSIDKAYQDGHNNQNFWRDIVELSGRAADDSPSKK